MEFNGLNNNNNVLNNNNVVLADNQDSKIQRLGKWALKNPAKAIVYAFMIWLVKKGVCQLVLRASSGHVALHKADTIKAVAQNALNQGTSGGPVGGSLKPGFGLRNGAWGWHA